MAEESKHSGLKDDGHSNIGVSLDDTIPDLEEILDFDIYPDDIPLIAEANTDLAQNDEQDKIEKVVHFTDLSSSSSEPIPFNLSSLQSESKDKYSDLETKPFSEDDLDSILLKDSSTLDDDGPIALSSDELDHITADNGDYSSNLEDSIDDYHSSSGKATIPADGDTFDSDELNDTYDTDIDDENVTLGSEELDHILNADEEEEEEQLENEQTNPFFDDSESGEEEEGPIALSADELNNITDSDYSGGSDFETDEFIPDQPSNLFENSSSEDEEIALSGDELNNILESGTEEEEEEDEDGNVKSFFDSEEEEEEDIALSPEELSNITGSEYSGEGIETEDLSSGIESNEYGVSTNISEEGLNSEDEDISLSGDELNNIIETGEVEVEQFEEEDIDSDNVKSFFDTEDDESIALSADELGNITTEQDPEESSLEGNEENFDLSESTEDLDLDTSQPNVFSEDAVEDEDIALSGDELNNLLESGGIESEEADSLGSNLFKDTSEEDESIALSADELGNITVDQDFSTEDIESREEVDSLDVSSDDLPTETITSLFEETTEEEEDIALSGDELNNLLESGNIESEEADSMGSSLFEGEEDETIALHPDELGNIDAQHENELQDDVNEDEDISLSGDELNNILETEQGEIEAANYDNPIDSGMVIGDEDFVIDDNSSLTELGEFNLDDSTYADTSDDSIEDTKDYSDQLSDFKFGSVKKEELKKVISYMDELLGSLPDSYIKEFASSEYFELYKKIMNELEL